MKLVIDTNIFVASISSKSKYHWIFQTLQNKQFDICVSNDILIEYIEIIQQKYNTDIAYSFIQFLINSSNVN